MAWSEEARMAALASRRSREYADAQDTGKAPMERDALHGAHQNGFWSAHSDLEKLAKGSKSSDVKYRQRQAKKEHDDPISRAYYAGYNDRLNARSGDVHASEDFSVRPTLTHLPKKVIQK